MDKQSPGWHPADIAAAIRKRGKTLTALALENGLSESACRKALILKYAKAELVIARFIDVSPHELWPDRWNSDETRRRAPRSTRKNIPVRS
ncbi:helix-turn-helix domain-containing protein [Oceanibaculum pacificum]|uniref:helix-turn-helix domain-containing protein n=1 Tax=Oceanibaculum pacificum TaxID=580166 RepID=UPI000A04FDBD|nr:helix-turn-helix domain-containing protein [Oceanibaculum pacificum]